MLELKGLTKKVVEHLPLATKMVLGPLPDAVVRPGIAFCLNRFFQPAIAEGELNFLHQKVARISVTDIGLNFSVSLVEQRLQVVGVQQRADVSLSAKQGDLLLLIAGRVDPDTLFFRRRLAITGDTELGLGLKNFLDRQDAGKLLPSPIHRVINQLVEHY